MVPTQNKTHIRSVPLDQLRDAVQALDQPAYRGGQIADWLYQRRANSFAEMTDLPGELRGKLADQFAFSNLEIVRTLGSRDRTRKFLFRLHDNNLIESVLIP